MAHRIFGKVRFADVAADEADKVETLCEDIAKAVEQLETVIAAAVADGRVTPDELDAIIIRLRRIGREAEDGRAL